MNQLYTIEYEELRGTSNDGRQWFSVIETFRAGFIDNPERRADLRVVQLMRRADTRNVFMLSWGRA